MISEIVEISAFAAAILKKMAEMSNESQLGSGNITNMIPESPLENCTIHGDARGPLLAHGLYGVYSIVAGA